LTGDCPTRRSTPCALQRKSLLTVHETRPELDANGAAARTAEDELFYALALATETVARDMTSRGRPMVSRRTIIARVHEWINAHAEPVKDLQHQVHDALKHVGEIGELRQQMQAAQRELNIQFQRIAQIQAQLDKLLAILTSPQSTREDT
jgi:hypothetical protein